MRIVYMGPASLRDLCASAVVNPIPGHDSSTLQQNDIQWGPMQKLEKSGDEMFFKNVWGAVFVEG